MVTTPQFLSLTQFADKVAELPICTDVEFNPSWRLELAPSGIQLAGRKVGALPLYQLKSLTDAGVNLSGSTGLEKHAVAGDAAATARIMHICQVINEGLNAYQFDTRPLTVRSFLTEAGAEVAGGIVTERYTPLTHLELVSRMMDVQSLREGATIDSWSLSVSRMNITMLVGDQRWEVDGGLKAGMNVGNGQFGDKARKFAAMLFRLLCTNGMMDVIDGEVSRKRHVGSAIDVAADLAQVLQRADSIFTAAKTSMEVQIDVIEALIELHRRGYLGRGPLRRAMERRSEVMGGRVVDGAETTVWGLSQSITAAGRNYSFNQRESLGRLAGRLVFEGMDVLSKERPIPNDAPTEQEVHDEFVMEAA